ncbi:hypothetical protein C8Q77DRAFT_781916 [Trametes polyzona]|nr:hypothetical protein C8Q77DRAFT_781916 [Trametes polyzona]
MRVYATQYFSVGVVTLMLRQPSGSVKPGAWGTAVRVESRHISSAQWTGPRRYSLSKTIRPILAESTVTYLLSNCLVNQFSETSVFPAPTLIMRICFFVEEPPGAHAYSNFSASITPAKTNSHRKLLRQLELGCRFLRVQLQRTAAVQPHMNHSHWTGITILPARTRPICSTGRPYSRPSCACMLRCVSLWAQHPYPPLSHQ